MWHIFNRGMAAHWFYLYNFFIKFCNSGWALYLEDSVLLLLCACAACLNMTFSSGSANEIAFNLYRDQKARD
jgi:hypothetical protein